MGRLRRLFKRVGRRGASLLFFGSVLALGGYGMLGHPPRDPELIRPLLEVLPITAWAVLWMTAGVLMWIGAVWKRLEEAAFFFGTGMFVAWALGAAFSGAYRWYVATAIYLSFAAFLMLIAGWPEPPEELDDPR